MHLSVFFLIVAQQNTFKEREHKRRELLNQSLGVSTKPIEAGTSNVGGFMHEWCALG